MRSQPFARALAMIELLAKASTQEELAAIGPYKSRGKGGKRPHNPNTGVAKARRAARKGKR